MGFYQKYNPWGTTLLFTILYFVFSSLITLELEGNVDVSVTFVYSLIFGIVYFFVARFVMSARL